jgi:hypothetical protein
LTGLLIEDCSMNRHLSRALRVGLSLLLLLGAALAQSGGTFEIVRSTVDGGGGRSSGGDFELVGTIAQPDADPAIATGGTFTLRGGFHTASGAPLADPIFADGFEG